MARSKFPGTMPTWSFWPWDIARPLEAVSWVFGLGRLDYMLNGTRGCAIPRGYAKDGVNENSMFDSNFVVQIGPVKQGEEQE